MSLMASSPALAVTKGATPPRPQHVRAEARNASAIIVFITPASNGGARVFRHDVVAYPQSQVHYCVRTTCRIGGLTNGVSYFFTVAALNKFGKAQYAASSNKVTPHPAAADVTCNANGGTGTMPNEVEYYGAATALKSNCVTKAGYTFNSWNTAAN